MTETTLKVAIPIIEEIMLRKKQTLFRTYVAILLWDQLKNGGKGFVSFNEFVHSGPLDISHKTIKNHLITLEQFGWLNRSIKTNRIYYRSQEKLFVMLQPERRTANAAYVTFGDISSKNHFKNWLMGAVIGGRSNSKTEVVTIARGTLRDKACGLSRKTQLKYENRIDKQFNYASLNNYTSSKEEDETVLYVDGQHVFKAKINGKLHTIKQIANTYTSNVQIGKRKRSKGNALKQMEASPYSLKTYLLEDQKPNKKTNEKFYKKTHYGISSGNLAGNLWFKQVNYA